jgi:hypothetical protein
VISLFCECLMHSVNDAPVQRMEAHSDEKKECPVAGLQQVGTIKA